MGVAPAEWQDGHAALSMAGADHAKDNVIARLVSNHIFNPC